ncbi:phospholipase [Intrasporangium oryzae NRRL B-24470]|uniref:Phospholipase n=1 Tax=Intrasporangium oryzae NRRL B-24470 TaxID=1386089 RepID=W9G7Q4_9MICO|nr:hypothetical protein [Intrasporangium oryzae]EWT01312.1 phospholipase [Intrasporangium oryzae NRRL B-24470]
MATETQAAEGAASSTAARSVPSRGKAVATVVAALAAVAIGAWLYGRQAPAIDILAVELGGGEQTWPPADGTASAITWDYVFIAGYAIALWLGTTTARWVFWSPRARRVALLGQGATIVGVTADLTENVLLSRALASDGRPSALLDAAAVAATVKFSVLTVAVVVAIMGVVMTLIRMRTNKGIAFTWPADKVIVPAPIEVSPPPPVVHPDTPGRTTTSSEDRSLEDVATRELGADGEPGERHTESVDVVAEARWRRAYAVPGVTPEALARRTAASDVSGVCLSGGGVRSASVALGALQVLRTELRAARYLVSISGGGYTSGAFAQLLTAAGDEDQVAKGKVAVHDAEHAYAPGSVEFDHIRRHSSYLADTAPRMLVALGVLARGLLASVLLLFVPAVLMGFVAAVFYRAIPVAVLPLLPGYAPKPNSAGVTTSAPPDTGLTIPQHALLAVAVVGGAALLLWLLQLLAYSNLSDTWQRIYGWAADASVFMTRIAVVVAVVAVVVPTIVWLAGRTISLVDGSVSVGISGSVGAVLLTYLTSLATLLWRRVKTVRTPGAGRKAGGTKVALPNGLLQQLLVIASVTVLVASWLVLFGVTTISTATDLHEGRGLPWALAAVLLVVVVVLGGFFDEASLSLHPFYRRRLATAFATRVVRDAANPASAPVAVALHSRERTPLSAYARAAASAEPFPEFVFSCAANLTGQQLTAPGLTAVSFTMTADWVGGPDVGWVDTATLEKLVPSRLRRDVTVQAAVAISGAAIASSMGRMSRWYQIVLAVSGARLGAWLPNPGFVAAMRAAHDAGRPSGVDWTLPGLPAIRRVTYLLREILNIHPIEERLLQVTDGGHYENLGIVELLRRRCTTIYCIDGGGDSPPTAPGLAEAITLAQSELGVRIELHRPFDTEPGIGTPIEPQGPLAVLNASLSREPVIAGTIHYPAASGLPEGARTGHLYVARALLWPDADYTLLSYAAQHPEFPHDSTADQWFTEGQFTAYTSLGRELGARVRLVRDGKPANG